MVRKHHRRVHLFAGPKIWADIFISSPSLLDKLIISQHRITMCLEVGVMLLFDQIHYLLAFNNILCTEVM